PGQAGGTGPGSPLAGAAYVVLTIQTSQGAWCEILFGTLPSRKRRAPVMPLLPTRTRSALVSSATSKIASAGSPSGGGGTTSTFAFFASAAALSSTNSTSSRGLMV